MANKNVRRERKDMARQQRIEQARREARRQMLRRAGTIAVVVVVAAGAVLLATQSGKQNQKKVASLDTLAAAAGCSSVQFPAAEGRDHVNPPRIVTYKTNPPTSGAHYEATADTGVSTAPIQNEYQVHNLEHGHVGIQYTDALPAAVRAPLEALARANDTYVFMAPRPGMPNELAFTAWTTLVTCKAPTDAANVEAVAKRFRELYQGKAPEDVPGKPA